MRFSTTSSAAETIVRLHARRVDAAVADELRRGLTAAIDSIAGRLVIDLAELEFMDSSALGALVGAVKTARTRDVSIAGANPAVRTVLRITRVDRAITVIEAAAP